MRNYVGYANNTLDTGYGAVMVAPQFIDVTNAKGEVSLDSLKPNVEGGAGDYSVEIQVLNNWGETIDSQDYAWIEGKWKNLDGSEIEEPVKFTAGAGLWVLCYNGELATTLTTAGQVNEADCVIKLDTGYGAVGTGNPYPVAITLDSLIPYAMNGDTKIDVGDYGVEIQVLNNWGETEESQDYAWIGGKWMNLDGSEITKPVTFDPGCGIWVLSYTGNPEEGGLQSYLRIPAPEY